MILEERQQFFPSFAVFPWQPNKCDEVPILWPVLLFLCVNGIRRRNVAFKMFGTHRHYNIGYVAECGAPTPSGRRFGEVTRRRSRFTLFGLVPDDGSWHSVLPTARNVDRMMHQK